MTGETMARSEWAIARVLSFMLYYSGGLRLFKYLDRKCRSGPRCMVIFYHRIGWEPLAYHDVAVSSRRFRRQLEYMKSRGYHFLSLVEYHRYLRGEQQLPGDSIVITFDDGYRDNYTAAFPVLTELGVPAAVFLCTGPIETGTALWWDRVVEAVRSLRAAADAKAPEYAELPARIAGYLQEALDGGVRSASDAIARLIDELKQYSTGERERILSVIEPRATSATGTGLMLTWDMIREMHRSGISFGAHSVTHPVFSQLTQDEARHELSQSKRCIEERLGEDVTVFAYPYGKDGYYNNASIDAVRECGFRWAYTTENGFNLPDTGPYVLRRNGIREIPQYLLAARLSGFFEHPLFRRLRKLIEHRRTGPADVPA